jgi:hypothetical protein
MMSRLNLRANLFNLTLLAFMAFGTAAICSAQVVTYDWAVKGDKPDSYPSQLTRKEQVTFQIRNVNDILYTYHLKVSLTPIPNNDWQNVAGLSLFPAVPGPLGNPCQQLLSDANGYLATVQKEINSTENTKLPIGYAALPKKDQKSVPLSDTLAQWNDKIRTPLDNLRDTAGKIFKQCNDPTFKTAYDKFQNAIKPIEDKVNGSHLYTNQFEIPPGTNVEATVLELYNGETLTTATFKFGVESNVLTLSAGALFSRIQDRSYEANKFPGMTQNVLVVQGNSRVVPGVVALLNYTLYDWDNGGFAVSAGPIVRFNNKSDASSLGFFTGISGNLYRRFYITPGINVAQFADFPVGFSNGSTVPSDFGNLTPVKRWTARFGLAITFKTTSFSGLTGSGGTKEAKVDVKETPKTSENRPPADINPLTSNTSNSLAGHVLRNNIVAQDKVVSVSNLYVSSSLESPSSLSAVVSLRSTETLGVTCVIVDSNAQIKDYRGYYEGGLFYVVIPNATLKTQPTIPGGRGFTGIQTDQRGNDLVIAFSLKQGVKAQVTQENKSLKVVFDTSKN